MSQPDVTPDLDTALARVKKLEVALADFADHGLRVDLNPSRMGGTTSVEDTTFWMTYLKRADDFARSRARIALGLEQVDQQVFESEVHGTTLPQSD